MQHSRTHLSFRTQPGQSSRPVFASHLRSHLSAGRRCTGAPADPSAGQTAAPNASACFMSTRLFAAATQTVVSRRTAVTTAAATTGSSSPTTLWSVTITSSTPLLGDSGTQLRLCVVDRDSDQRTGFINTDDPDAPWSAPVPVVGSDGVKGWTRQGAIRVPATFGRPSAVLVIKQRTTPEAHSLDYISTIDLVTPSEGLISIPCHSWVSSRHGERVFFEGTPYLPQNTPPQLEDERKAELKILRGEVEERHKDKCALRSYGYMVYDDLYDTDKNKKNLEEGKPVTRPPLGFTDDSKLYPYPRRIATKGRGKDCIPYDEQFNYSKQQGFSGDTLAGVAVALSRGVSAFVPSWVNNFPAIMRPALAVFATMVSLLPFFPKPSLDFEKFDDVRALYKEDDGLRWLPSVLQDANETVAELRAGLLPASAKGKSFEEQNPNLPEPALGATLDRAKETLLKDNSGEDLDDLLRYPVPRVEDNRAGMWAEDLEFGRQALAGMNPCSLQAVTKELPRGTSIKAEHVDDDLETLGNTTLSKLLAAGGKPRLFLIDYWFLNFFWEEPIPEDPSNGPAGEEHVGRCLMYLCQDTDGKDTGLVPLAIELLPRSRSTSGQMGGTVYSRYELEQAGKEEVLWRLAKAIFKSIDSGHHQLVSHFLRCHACTEPFLIAMRRTMSAMHPMTKLMLPHFRYTMNINTNARASLINEGGTIESAFTPGAFAIRLTSAAYRSWRFRQQGLPADLKARGLMDDAGKPVLTDYPYADDGLDLWRAYEDYFKEYLGLYYTKPDPDDGSPNADVEGDTELRDWWTEVKTEGHKDITTLVKEEMMEQGMDAAQAAEAAEVEVWGFAGPITRRSQLVHVLTTIAWIASGHHAAVNFGQYDYSALMLNVASLVRRPIPEPGAVNDKAYKALVESSDKAQEKEYLTYLTDFIPTVKVMTTVKLLSSHANDEHYLDEPNTNLMDPAAVALNQRFINKMKALEVSFLNRNADSSRWTRKHGDKKALEYTLLYPGSGPGVTMRGVPYSVSI